MKKKHKIVLIALGALVILVAVLIPKVREARREANRAVSLTNIKAIDTACYLYANANHGEYPPTLDVLLEQGVLRAESLVNPNRPELKVGYVYIKPTGLTAYELIFYEDFDEWDQGILTNLGFIPDEDLFKKVLVETQEGAGLSLETLEELSKIRDAVIHIREPSPK